MLSAGQMHAWPEALVLQGLLRRLILRPCLLLAWLRHPAPAAVLCLIVELTPLLLLLLLPCQPALRLHQPCMLLCVPPLLPLLRLLCMQRLLLRCS